MTAQQKLQPSHKFTTKLYHVQREKSRKELKIMENMKFLQARDVVLAVIKAMEFTNDEIRQVLQMCNDEVDAWDKRAKLVEMNKEGEE